MFLIDKVSSSLSQVGAALRAYGGFAARAERIELVALKAPPPSPYPSPYRFPYCTLPPPSPYIELVALKADPPFPFPSASSERVAAVSLRAQPCFGRSPDPAVV